MSLFAFALTAAAQVVQPQSTMLPVHPVDGYFTCVAATARAEALKGSDDEVVLRAAHHSCGFIAEEAIYRLHQNSPDQALADRFSRDYGIEVPPSLTGAALSQAGDVRARKVAASVRAEHEGK